MARGHHRLSVAYALTITTNTSGPYLDGAAILAFSVLRSESRHHVSLVAILPPAFTAPWAALQAAGYQIVERKVPVARDEIEGTYLRETIETAGCCGSLELLKLHAFALTEYDCVLLLDLDTLVLRNLDSLFETSVQRGLSLTYTSDEAMYASGSAAMPVQGGFLLVRPSLAMYRKLVATVRKGDFSKGTGWAGSRIGWCWGGRTIQGLLAYHYRVAEVRALSCRINSCLYNRMHPAEVMRAGRVLLNCSAVPVEKAYSLHFTVCTKPWKCRRRPVHPACDSMHRAWWNFREELERSNGLQPAPFCGLGSRTGGNDSYISLMPRLLALRDSPLVLSARAAMPSSAVLASRIWQDRSDTETVNCLAPEPSKGPASLSVFPQKSENNT